jgi:two-component system sensor histidine kinase ChiS
MLSFGSNRSGNRGGIDFDVWMVWLQKSDWEKTRTDREDGDYYTPKPTKKGKKKGKGKVEVKIDKDRIAQVIRNLIGNAIKFTKEGTIKCYLQKQGHNIEVIIRDNGVGIPDNELETIFSPFIQSTRTKNNAGGTGLGLSICKEIIMLHQGRIWVTNNQDQGASFHFLIPNVNNHKNVQNQNININQINSSKKVLIIDDDQISHSVLGLMLKSNKCIILNAFGGKEGLEMLKDNKSDIDLILLDLMMPDIYGLNVLQEIKKNSETKKIPVIIQSASHDKTEHERAIKLGASGFIQKPYDRNKFTSLFNKYLKT